ncbi:MAG: flavin reductase family protein [Boseongicola sp.]|nr:flavin reductase family protein [Boseongicola sp.]MDD9979251.1 flavin reductase family protein [Boseongicola sp.]
MPDGDFRDMMRFTPGPDTSRQFRDALSNFATGVTVVTCRGPEGPVGITANSFASLSLDPPLVLWSPARASKRFAAFEAADNYAIHVLSSSQMDVCRGFARNGTDFSAFDWETSAENVPLLNGCLARFECLRHAVHDGGDHAIIVGRVTNAAVGPGEPLIFSGGSYGGFSIGD